jgi:hypothetical protein
MAALVAAQRIVDSFIALYGSIDCRAITGVDFMSGSAREVVRYFRNNGTRCFRMAAQYSPVAFSHIATSLAGPQPEPPEPPLSCAAETCRRLGAAEMHVVMASGLAGGVGLSGDACGALAAAVWVRDLEDRRHGARKTGFANPRAAELVDRFAAGTDGEFLCSAIVGRRFENVGDHAAHLHGGGCAGILETLTEGERAPV